MVWKDPATQRYASAMGGLNRPLRILELLPTSSPGGGPKHVWNLVHHLPRDQFEPIIGAPRDGVFFARFRELGLQVVEFPRRWLGVRHVLLATRLISQLGIDIVHTHGDGPGLYGRLAARCALVPSIHTVHRMHYSAYSPLGRRLCLALERGLSRMTHTIIHVSTSQYAEALGLRLCRPEQGVLIVNGVDLDHMERRAIQSPVRRETLGLTIDNVVLGNVSRFDPAKHIDVLVETVQILKPRLPHLILVLVGGGRNEERIRRQVLDKNLQHNVVFTGSLPDAAHMYRVFDLYIAASPNEGLPLSLVEAMAAGLPIVAMDAPGHQDVVVHGETGLLVPPGDCTALAQAIVSLVSDPVRRKAMGEAGRGRAHKKFAVRSMVEATAHVYWQAAGRE